MTTRNKWIVFVVTVVPILSILSQFFCGLFGLSPDYIIFLLPVILFGPPLAGIVTAILVFNASILKRIVTAIGTGIGIYAAILVIIIIFHILPPLWVLGASANFRLTKHGREVQQWAVKTLDQYENGTLQTNTNTEYWAIGTAKLEDSQIPEQIRTLWPEKPSIGIATITDNGRIAESIPTNVAVIPNLTGGQSIPLNLDHCVTFSWYDWGFLVGRPDFQSKWNPGAFGGEGYIHEIKPGIYVYLTAK
jgi:nitrate reductase NapE component